MDEDEPDYEGLFGLEEEGLDEGDFEIEDMTTELGDTDLDTFEIDTQGINEEVMLVNDADLKFDRSDVGLYSGRTIYLKEPVRQKIPIKTKYGVIMCDTHCENCPYISICTKAMDHYISGLADLSAVRKPKCRAGYQLMRHKTTGKYKCVRRKRVPPKKKKVSKSPFSSFFIFKKSPSDPPLLKAGYSFGNFLFFAAVILGIAWITPHVLGVGKKTADFSIDTWKKVKEVRLLGRR